MIPPSRQWVPDSLPKWRNWQTRQVQDLVPVKGVEVRVLSSAPFRATTWGNPSRCPCSWRSDFSAGRASTGRFRTETHMAGIRKQGDGYYCTFRFQGKRFYFALGNLPEAQA